MVNSNVDETSTKQNKPDHEQNGTSIHENSCTVQKEEIFDAKSLNKVIITEPKNENNYNNNVNDLEFPEDTVINVKINETCTSQQNERSTSRSWIFNVRRLLTRYLWKQRYLRQQVYQGKPGYLQGYPQKKQQVLFQHEHYQPKEMHHFG